MSENKLNGIALISGRIELQSGLHIGGGNTEIRIGGVDNTVIKHPHTNEPYIPGSSLKGKIRSLLEWYIGVVGKTEGKPLSRSHLEKCTNEKEDAIAILKLFGFAADQSQQSGDIGPTRLAFWDCMLNQEFATKMKEANQLLTEVKAENSINRIAGVADNPRFTERVPAGSIFDFKLTMKQLMSGDNELLDWVLLGMKLLEHDSLGGSGSRGYGKIRFIDLELNGESLQEKFDSINVFGKGQVA
jgi:CRISPR-associated protein Csm3